MRVFYWLGVFLLSALVAHLSYVLFLPKHEARAFVRQLRTELGANTFALVSNAHLRRLVRHPLPDAQYGACVISVDERHVAILKGPPLRAAWMLTVYSPRGDVIYAITDRHMPAGAADVRFEYSPPSEENIVSLPEIRRKVLVAPLNVRQAVLVVEAFPWHPGQAGLVRGLMERMRCSSERVAARQAPPPSPASAVAGEAAPLPRARPQRAAP